MMQNELPSLRALAAFDAVAQFESFSLGAEYLCVTHGAVSRQVRLLEETLNTTLFIRSGTGTTLTENGQTLFSYTRKSFVSLQQGISALQRIQQSSLRISVDISFASQWLITKLQSFKSEYPSIPVYLHTEDQIVDPNNGSIDIAIRYGQGDWPNVHAEELMEEQLIAVASPMLLEQKLISTDPASLLQFPLLQDDFHRDCWRSWAERAGIAYKHLPKPELNAAHTGWVSGKKAKRGDEDIVAQSGNGSI